MHAQSVRLSGKRMYIAHLAARLESMESGRTAMDAVAYRLFARRMNAARPSLSFRLSVIDRLLRCRLIMS